MTQQKFCAEYWSALLTLIKILKCHKVTNKMTNLWILKMFPFLWNQIEKKSSCIETSNSTCICCCCNNFFIPFIPVLLNSSTTLAELASNSSYLILIYDIIFLTIFIFIMGIVFVTWKHEQNRCISWDTQKQKKKKGNESPKNAKWTNFVLVSSHGEIFLFPFSCFISFLFGLEKEFFFGPLRRNILCWFKQKLSISVFCCWFSSGL